MDTSKLTTMTNLQLLKKLFKYFNKYYENSEN